MAQRCVQWRGSEVGQQRDGQQLQGDDSGPLGQPWPTHNQTGRSGSAPQRAGRGQPRDAERPREVTMRKGQAYDVHAF